MNTLFSGKRQQPTGGNDLTCAGMFLVCHHNNKGHLSPELFNIIGRANPDQAEIYTSDSAATLVNSATNRTGPSSR